MIQNFAGVLRREIMLLCRRPVLWLTPLAFFVLAATLFSIAVGARPTELRTGAPGLVCVSALLAGLLSHEGIFRADYESGFLEQALVSAQPLAVFIAAKTFAHWLFTGVPLTLAAPLVAMLLYFPLSALPALLMVLPTATAALSVWAAFGAALTLASKNGLLTALLLLPLLVPVLIFAAATLENAVTGAPLAASLSLLAALTVLSATFLPLATAAVLSATGGR